MNEKPSQTTTTETAGQAAPQPVSVAAPPPLSPEDERTWAMLAHLSVLLNLVTGLLGVAAALVIYLVYRDRSRYVAFQAMQAFLMQLILWAGGGLLIGVTWAFVGLLSAILIGILLIPIAVLLTIVFIAFPVIALVYGVVGGIQCSNGQDFRYWLIADLAENMV